MSSASPAGGKIITFYSYKGGTGRTMALANLAWILASNGKRVLALDWDLEAPGLHRYFRPFLDDADLTSSEGLLDYVLDYALSAMTPTETEKDRSSPEWYAPQADIRRYAVALDLDKALLPRGDEKEQGTIEFVPAGRQGPSYAVNVNSFNWGRFYDTLGGGRFLDVAKQRMREQYDYVLIDSRTGLSDTSGICTVYMPDILVVCFTLNIQSIEGARAVAGSVRDQRSEVRIFPVPMRIELGERVKLARMLSYARDKFSPFLVTIPERERDAYWKEVAVQYVPYFAFEEQLAALLDPADPNPLLGSFEQLASRITDQKVTKLVRNTEVGTLTQIYAASGATTSGRDALAALLESAPEWRPFHDEVSTQLEQWVHDPSEEHLLNAKTMARLSESRLLHALLEMRDFRVFWDASREKERKTRNREAWTVLWAFPMAALVLAAVPFVPGLSLPVWSDQFTILFGGIAGGTLNRLRHRELDQLKRSLAGILVMVIQSALLGYAGALLVVTLLPWSGIIALPISSARGWELFLAVAGGYALSSWIYPWLPLLFLLWQNRFGGTQPR